MIKYSIYNNKPTKGYYITMIDSLINAVTEAGYITLNADRCRKFDEKSSRTDFVTEYDKAVQNFLCERFSRDYPSAKFICEENDRVDDVNESDYLFIIDPIDGTTNFIHNVPEYVISVALFKGSSPLAAVVYQPAFDALYYCEHGKGSYKTRGNETVKLSSSTASLDGALVVFGTSPYNEELKKHTLKFVDRLLKRAVDVRRTGSAALDICRTAEGIYDIMFEMKLSVWDYAAAGMILYNAGGVCSDQDGNSLYGKLSSSFVGGNSDIVSDFLKERAKFS